MLTEKQKNALMLGRKKGIRRTRPLGLKYILHKENPTAFKKGHKPWCEGTKGVVVAWNKGIKGVLKANSGSFSKNQEPWNINKRIWNGNKKDYFQLHYWVRKQKGKPCRCESCGRTERLVWSNISQKYKKEINDWKSLCRSCHIKNDMKYIKENIV